jgi:hypothetical protein
MRDDLEEKYKQAVERFNESSNDKNKSLVWNCIYEACKAEFLSYIKKKGVRIETDVMENIISDSVMMIYGRVTIGMKKGKFKGKRLNIEHLGAYCYSVVLNEYKRYVLKYFDEKKILDGLCNAQSEILRGYIEL